MGKEVVYCSVCGDRIPSSDFQKDKAVTAQGHHYCRTCAGGITNDTPPREDPPGPTPTPRPTKVRPTWMARVEKSELENFPTTYLIVGATLVAVALVVLIVLFRKPR